jgi:hypothetical protein
MLANVKARARNGRLMGVRDMEETRTSARRDWLEYERYKAYLAVLNLTPAEYEKRIKSYCGKHNL